MKSFHFFKLSALLNSLVWFKFWKTKLFLGKIICVFLQCQQEIDAYKCSPDTTRTICLKNKSLLMYILYFISFWGWKGLEQKIHILYSLLVWVWLSYISHTADLPLPFNILHSLLEEFPPQYFYSKFKHIQPCSNSLVMLVNFTIQLLNW